MNDKDEGLRECVEWLLALVSESKGVVGYHKNGDIAPWSEFDEELNNAGDALYRSRHPAPAEVEPLAKENKDGK